MPQAISFHGEKETNICLEWSKGQDTIVFNMAMYTNGGRDKHKKRWIIKKVIAAKYATWMNVSRWSD